MATTPRWRPQPLWIPMGVLLGALSGAITGSVLVFGIALLDEGVTFSEVPGFFEALGAVVPVIVVGSVFGGIAGAVVGLAVGAQLTFLVGSHLPLDAARRRAHRLGFVLPPLTLAIACLLLGGGSPSMPNRDSLSMPLTEALWWVVCLGGASLLGARFARWFAGVGRARRASS